MSPLAIVLNVTLFQVAWLSAVLGAAWGMPWFGALAVLAAAGVHLARADSPGQELKLLALAVLIGAVFESLLVKTGLLEFEGGAIVAGTAPVWMVALWANFATTLNVSLRLLRSRLLAAAALGAVGAPLAYYGGSQLGAVEMISVGPALAAIAAGWAIFTPLLFLAARRFDGYSPR